MRQPQLERPGVPPAVGPALQPLQLAIRLALPAHVKNGFIEKRLLFHSVLSGLIGTALAAYVATALDVALLHRFFGFFLILVGISELFQNPKRKNEMDRRN